MYCKVMVIVRYEGCSKSSECYFMILANKSEADVGGMVGGLNFPTDTPLHVAAMWLMAAEG